MKRISAFLLALCLFATVASAQTPPCAASEVTQKQMNADPRYALEIAAMRQQLLNSPLVPGGSRGTRTISVAVHVVYSSTSQNVSTTSINNLIATLNRDYSATNTDLSQVRSAFTSVIGNPQIQFCLDTIVRRSSTHGCFDYTTQTNEMKSNATGGSTPIDPYHYLNIWIVDLCGNTGGGIAGYAYFPTNGMHGSNIDGLVIDYSLGYNNGNGRTATHEIGHYFGLDHTFESCTPGDGFSDTPPTNAPNYNCTATILCGAASPGTQYENFMDYCSNPHMFTLQQAARMNNILSGTRASLLNSTGCSSAPAVPVADFTSTATSTCPGGSITFNDVSSGTPTSWSWSFTGGTPSTSTAQNPTIVYNTPGTYAVTLTASNANGSDSETKTAYITVTSAINLPLSEGFQATTFPPTGWSLQNPGSDTTWRRTTAAGGYGASTASMFINNFAYNAAGAQDLMLTPIYNFSSVTNARLTFDYAYARYDVDNSDSLAIIFTNDCGASFYLLQQKGGTTLATRTDLTTAFVPTASQWKTDTISLTFLAGQSTVQFGFLNITGYGNNLYVDNINIATIAPPAPVANFSGTPLTINPGGTVNFTDLSTNSPTSWSWSFPGAVTTTSTVQNPTGIQYNNVGTYTVTLTATNSQGSDSETKTAYITVTNAPILGGCDTLSNISATSPLYLLPLDGANPIDSGYVVGHNIYLDKAKAEKFTGAAAGANINGALMYFGKAKFANAASKIQVKVWDASGTGGAPGTQLYTQDVLINTLSTTQINNITFTTPPVVPANGSFFVGFQITYAAGDTVALASTADTTVNTAWEMWSDNTWHTFTGAWGFDAALAIFPRVCTVGPIPVAGFTGTPTTVCAGSTVTYIDQSTNSPTSWIWSFPGGTPATSTAQNPTITYNTAGSYTATLIAINGNGRDTLVRTSYITVRSTPTATTVATDALCFGGSTGTVNLTVTGGTPGYTYTWSNGPTTEDLAGLGFGTYTVTVTDANGCKDTASASVSQPVPITLSASSTNATCNLNDGTASASANGGTPPFGYQWSNGLGGTSISGLAPGTYTVTATDANGCIKTATTTVTSSGGISVSATSTNTTCGNTNGSVTVVATGGSGYTYVWSSGQTGTSATNLPSGTYTITVTAASGCADTVSATVASSTGISVSMSSTQANCGQSNGSATATPSGGSGYTYLWNTGSTNSSLTNIAAGNYTVTVTATGGCTATGSVSVSNVGAPTVTVNNVTNVLCNGASTGAIDINVTGGTTPYTYNWTPSGSSQDLSSIPAGIYQVTVTANNGCIATASATVTQPTAVTASATAQNVSCFGGSNGAITLTASGGTAPLSYNWSGAAPDVQNPSGLTAGSYTVTITDNNGCTATSGATVGEPSQLSITVNGTNPGCGANNGTATAVVTGGTAGYTYQWSTSGTGSGINSLAAGTYTVTVTDANGCTASGSKTLSAPAGPGISVTSTNVTCGGSADGTATVTVSGGTSPFTYAWTGGQTGPNATGLSAGSYTVTVTDANGCTSTATANITSLSPVVTAVETDVRGCNGDNTGSVVLTVSGGATPYNYSWSSGQSSSSIFTLTAGTYTVTVIDNGGCSAVQTYSITEPDALSAGVDTTFATAGQSNGIASATVSGGVTPYSYSWSTGQSSQSITGLAAGNYTVTITDASGCMEVVNYTISTTTGINTLSNAFGFEVFPNPNEGRFVVRVSFNETTECSIQIFNAIGKLIYTIDKQQIKAGDFEIDLSAMPSANYYVKLSTGNYNAVKKVTRLN
jgi:PKD repeat protein